MPHLPTGIIIERTPMRDLARRLVEVLYEAHIPAWMAPRAGLEVAAGGALKIATAWDIRVAEPEADSARGAIAAARRRLHQRFDSGSEHGRRVGMPKVLQALR